MTAKQFTPEGIIAIDKQGDRVLFLDPVTLEVVGEIPGMPTLPHELAVSPDRRRAYVPAYGDGIHGDNPHPNHVVSVIDLQSRQLVSNIDLAPLESPHTMRFGADGLLYVACENSGAIAIVDPVKYSITGHIETGSTNSHRLTIVPNAGLICTDNEEDASVSILDMGTREAIARIALPVAIAGITASGDERRLYCTDAERPRLWPIRLDGFKLEAPIALEGHEKGSQVVRTGPDGRFLLVIGDHESLVSLVDLPTGEQRRVTVGAKPMDGAFHPDGRTFLIANEGEGTVSQIDLETARVMRKVPVGTGCETLAYF